ncbi:hypothetical protein [Olleya marilimosa]|uniref:DUF4870 domain-containing protein n=1 Tax=Olleya marilimosa TaxID=272164 RepID=A0ABR8M1B3_9FLAO|nr:hypothetical protein [Olleya marilimosa]MBD3864323.1 hypothetical protein [Olleya marilimosa]
MKNLYAINSWAFIICVLISFTVYGAIIALPILGIIQIIISVKIGNNFKQLPKSIKISSFIYLLSVLMALIIIKIIVLNQLLIFFIWSFMAIILAGFHLAITRLIINYNTKLSQTIE